MAYFFAAAAAAAVVAVVIVARAVFTFPFSAHVKWATLNCRQIDIIAKAEHNQRPIAATRRTWKKYSDNYNANDFVWFHIH